MIGDFRDEHGALSSVDVVQPVARFCDNLCGTAAVPPPPEAHAEPPPEERVLARTHGAHDAVLGIAAIENAFCAASARLPPAMRRTDDAYVALVAACSLLSVLEGPLWKEIRGAGLSYGYALYASARSGTLSFGLSKSADVAAAYAATRAIVRRYASNKENTDRAALESAVAVSIFDQLYSLEVIFFIFLLLFFQ